MKLSSGTDSCFFAFRLLFYIYRTDWLWEDQGRIGKPTFGSGKPKADIRGCRGRGDFHI